MITYMPVTSCKMGGCFVASKRSVMCWLNTNWYFDAFFISAHWIRLGLAVISVLHIAGELQEMEYTELNQEMQSGWPEMGITV